MPEPPSPHGDFWHDARAGLAEIFPLLLAAIPFSLVLGALAVRQGLSPLVAPATLAAGWPEAVALVVVALLALRAPGLVAIVAGVALVVALRRLGA